MLTAFAVVGELTDDRIIGPNDKNRNENVLNLSKKVINVIIVRKVPQLQKFCPINLIILLFFYHWCEIFQFSEHEIR